MKRTGICVLIALFGMMLVTAEVAQAKRFGGGSSFGKHRSAPASSPAQHQKATPGQPANGQKGSARSGMMGMLGGLALGGMLGALFFGGAFEGINFLDILLLGLIAVAVIVWLRKRAATAMPRQDYAYAGGQSAQSERSSASVEAGEQQHDFSTASARPNIDEMHFLQAAKTIFMRMQKAWDERNSEDIRQFCTAEVADKICADMAQDNAQHRTEVGMLDAELLDSWLEDDRDWVAVRFTAMLKEQTLDAQGQPLQEETSEVHETWTFSHDPSDQDPTWYLSGISQS